MIPLASADAVRRAAPRADLCWRTASTGTARDGLRLRARTRSGRRPATRGDGRRAFFFPKHGAVVEDPGTGSACANLGGWLIATGAPLPQRIAIAQGDAVGRPCRLRLEVTADRRIRVSGRVVELGRGHGHAVGRPTLRRRNRLLHVATDDRVNSAAYLAALSEAQRGASPTRADASCRTRRRRSGMRPPAVLHRAPRSGCSSSRSPCAACPALAASSAVAGLRRRAPSAGAHRLRPDGRRGPRVRAADARRGGREAPARDAHDRA